LIEPAEEDLSIATHVLVDNDGYSRPMRQRYTDNT